MKREGGGEEEKGRREREKEGKREGEGVIHIYPKIRSIMVNT